MAGWLSLSNILLSLGLIYFIYTASSLYQLFQSPFCEDPQTKNVGKSSSHCVQSLLVVKRDPPKLEIRVGFSVRGDVDSSLLLKRKQVTAIPLQVDSENGFLEDLTPVTSVNISIPASVRQHNGTLFVIAGLVRVFSENESSMPRVLSWDADAITMYAVAKADTMQLLSGGGQNKTDDSESSKKLSPKTKTPEKKGNDTRPCTHWRNKLYLLLTNDLSPLPPVASLSAEFHGLVYSYRHSDNRYYYVPPVHIDRLVWREKELIKIKPDDVELPIEIQIRSSTLGRLRFRYTIYQSMESMKLLGFADHDLDDVKSLFADTSLWLLLVTVFVSTLHLIFDFLAFKNDVSFWRNRKNTSGISTRGIVWRAVSSFVIFLYLVDEKASLLVTLPMTLSLGIEIWKLAKAMHIKGISLKGVSRTEASAEEKQTDVYDAQAMRWLGLLMIPLLLGCAGYSLIYVPHRSWYSWTIASLVNAVYAFGFLFMLPQLFINYRLKSVAHLPWRVFIYRALNTFIDDLFAFIIAMPTAHRIACLRDDVVFVIYIYQRWLYPVDLSRPTEMPDSDSATPTAKAAAEKKDD